MDCLELKENILNKTLHFDYLILKYSDNNFICNQYINEIAKINNLDIYYINDLKEAIKKNSFNVDSYLYVFNTEEFNDSLSNEYSNLIVVCSKSKLQDHNLIDIPKLEEWQILDYMKITCPGLCEDELSWLYTICKKDIFRIDRELSKLKIFPKVNQDKMFMLLNREDNYKDLNILTVFDFTNAILKKDRQTIAKIISNLDVIDVEGTGVVTILLSNILNIINVQFNPKATAESLGLKDNQFKAIKYKVGKFTNNQLISIYEFLTSIDYRLKNGDLSLSNDELVDYITCNILTA